MKKISVFILLALLLTVQTPSNAKILAEHRARIEQNKITKTTTADLKAVFGEVLKQANKHNLVGMQSVYSKDFVNSDGFNYDIYMKMVEDTWKTYPDITYTSEITNIEFDENYARVYVTETATATSEEEVGQFKTIGELYSISKCIYHLKKHGTIWLIESEQILEETSTLKYGDARYINIELNSPKYIGANKYYTSALTLDVPEKTIAVASIGKENIVYPQATKTDEVFRKLSNENILERVFLSNKDNLNEYNMVSIGLTQAENYDKDHIRVYMTGLAFIMTRVNVVPENKFVKLKTGTNISE